MTEVRPEPLALAWDDTSGGVRWHVELDRAVLLPGRLVGGRMTLVAERSVEARQLEIALVGEEHWRHDVSSTDAQGHTTTETVTSHADLPRVPEVLHGPLRLNPGERWEAPFDLPVPALGPPTLDAEEAGVAWRFETKLDIDNAFDASTERPVVVAQPTALLRAGVVHVGEFALYESVNVEADGVVGSIELRPMPLVTGESFDGRVRMAVGERLKLQEIRAEMLVHVEATVSSGKDETITAWAAVLAPGGEYHEAVDLTFTGELGPRPLPTVELPHGRAQARLHVILARAWSPDIHLVRDVTVATTREL